jgi:hypothetical protein
MLKEAIRSWAARSGLVLLGMWAATALRADADAKVVQCRRLVLEDKAGRPRAEIGVGDDGAVYVEYRDASGRIAPPRSLDTFDDGSSRRTKATADLQAIADAIALFHGDTGQWPHALEDLFISAIGGWNGPYLKGAGHKAILDPWKRPYVYQFIGAGSPPYALATYGADGVPGGTGEDADIFYGAR